MKKISIIFFALSLLALGCKSTRQEKKQNPSDFIHIEIIKKGSYSGIDYSGHLVITNADDWAKRWADLYGTQSRLPPIPTIDFDKKMVIAVYMGNKSSGGFSVDVERVELAKKELKIKAVYNMPGQGCMSTMAITQPFVLVSVEKKAFESSSIEVSEKKYKCN